MCIYQTPCSALPDTWSFLKHTSGSRQVWGAFRDHIALRFKNVENMGEEFAETLKPGLGSKRSAEPLGACRMFLHQAFPRRNIPQNLRAAPQRFCRILGSGGGGLTCLLRTGFFPPTIRVIQ